MKQILKYLLFYLLIEATVFLSCKKDFVSLGEINNPPIANAGSDQNIQLPIDSTILDARASKDRDGIINKYLWTKISGPVSFNISKPSDSITVVKDLITGIYQFELKVTDNGSLSAKDTLRIVIDSAVITNHPPIAHAGPDMTITLPINTLYLDGSKSEDPENNIITYRWTQVFGPSDLYFLYPDSVKAIAINPVKGVYGFELKVTDAGNLSAKDTLRITIDSAVSTNHPPIANAGPDMNIQLPLSTFSLDGSKSEDPENNIIMYRWTQVFGPTELSILNSDSVKATAVNPVEGVYQFELKVTDAGGLFSKDMAQITVIAAPNCNTFTGCYRGNPPTVPGTLTQIGTLSVPRIPTAAAADNKVVFAGGLINFQCGSDGWYFASASSAVDIYDIVNHSWSIAQLSKPRGGMRSVSCKNKIFFAGGEDGKSNTYDNVDIYDIATNTWSVAHLSSPRAYVTTATVGNKVFFAGGYFNADNPSPSSIWFVSNTVDIYDLSTNQWSATTLSRAATGLCIATTLSDKIYFAGGNQERIIDIYDNTTNTWSTSKLQFQFQWDDIKTWGFEAGNPIVSFAAGGNMYWVGQVNEGIFDIGGDCDYIHTGRIEIKNGANGATSIKCAPLIFSQHAEYRNDEIAFFPTFSYPRQSSGHYLNWSVDNRIPIYNATTGNWSIVQFNKGSFITSFIDAGAISANNTIYIGGGSDRALDCFGFTDEVYIINW